MRESQRRALSPSPGSEGVCVRPGEAGCLVWVKLSGGSATEVTCGGDLTGSDYGGARVAMSPSTCCVTTTITRAPPRPPPSTLFLSYGWV